MSLPINQSSSVEIKNSSDLTNERPISKNEDTLQYSTNPTFCIDHLNEVFNVWDENARKLCRKYHRFQSAATVGTSCNENVVGKFHKNESNVHSCMKSIGNSHNGQISFSQNLAAVETSKSIEKQGKKNRKRRDKCKCPNKSENEEASVADSTIPNSEDQVSSSIDSPIKQKKAKKTRRKKIVNEEECLKLFQFVAPDIAERMDRLCSMLSFHSVSDRVDEYSSMEIPNVTPKESSQQNMSKEKTKAYKKLANLVRKKMKEEEKSNINMNIDERIQKEEEKSGVEGRYFTDNAVVDNVDPRFGDTNTRKGRKKKNKEANVPAINTFMHKICAHSEGQNIDSKSETVEKGNKGEARGNSAAVHNRSGRFFSPKKTDSPNGKSQPFEEYWALDCVKEGLKNGTVIEGIIRINLRRFTEAYVSSPTGGQDILIDGLHDRNRALEGDLVAVCLKDSPEWKIKTQGNDRSKVDVNSSLMNEDEDDIFENSCCLESNNLQKPQVTGIVVAILVKQHPRKCGGFLKLMKPKDRWAIFSPRDSRVPRIKIRLDRCPKDFISDPASKQNTIYEAIIVEWNSGTFALGEILRKIGEAGNVDIETEAILVDNDLDVTPLEFEGLAFLDGENGAYGREDLRKKCIFTIDPETAKDLDDALSCRELENGNLEIGVHIADVTYYLKENTDLDIEVAKRATSVYLVNKVYHMLPLELCFGCSLLPGMDRFSFSVLWEISKSDAKIISQRIVRSKIRSCAKLAYEHAQLIIENPNGEWDEKDFPEIGNGYSLTDIVMTVKNLEMIAKKLRCQRFENGTLRIDQTKMFINLDSCGMPNDVHEYINKESHRLVEEFMLLANMSVAKHIYEKFPDIAFLRCHPEPHKLQLEQLQEAMAVRGIHLNISSAGALQASLARYSDDDFFSKTRLMVLNSLCAKTMARAKYFCSANVPEEEFWHYSLSVPFYTHFTSPIRRYADVMVHRLLNAAIGYCPKPLWREDYIAEIAATCNKKKYSAKLAEEQSKKLYLSVYLKNNQPVVEDAVVIDVKDYSFDVIICKFGLTMRVYVAKLDAEIFCDPDEKNTPMKIEWKSTETCPYTTSQIVDVFTIVKVNIYCDRLLKLEAKLVRPEKST